MQKRWISVFFAFIFTSILVYWIVNSSIVISYITAVKEKQSISVFQPVDPNKQLYEKIKHEAKKHTISPIDASVDIVWKAAVPGYNGKQVDIEATYKKRLKQYGNKIDWVYKEIKPKKSLEDLGTLPIYRGNEHKKAVAIMINVAWGTEYIDSMLQILKERGAKATFFLDGSWLKENTNVALKIQREGHEIGNHAYSHPLMAQITSDRVIDEMKRTEDLISQILHVHSKNFAPPAGSFDQRTVDIAKQFNMRTILWTVDTIDWRKSSTPELMIQRVEKKLKPGSLVLMHPTDRTVQALPSIIDYIQRKNLKLLTVSDILSPKRLD